MEPSYGRLYWLCYVAMCVYWPSVESATIAFVTSCKHDTEFSKSVAYNMANGDVNNYFITDESCADSVKLPNVQVFSDKPWVNTTLVPEKKFPLDENRWPWTGLYNALLDHSDQVQERMDEVVRSAETMQRLMERESVQLVVADSYSTCAAAVAEMHDIPVLLMHNSGFPQATANPTRVQYSFIPRFFYSIAPDFIKTLTHDVILVLFKNLPDVRMTISIGNKCNADLQTNKSHSSVPHFWSSYPRVGSLSPPLVEYNKKTKHFIPMGLMPLVEKGKPKSNRLDNFMKPSGDDSVDFAYFTGEESLLRRFGWKFFHDSFTLDNTLKTIWTNKSLPNFASSKQIMVTPMSVHSIMTEEKVRVIVGTCSLDNVLVALHYQRILVCFDVVWRESALARSIELSGVGITLWPMFTTANSLKESIKSALDRRTDFQAKLKEAKVGQTPKVKALKDLVFELTEMPASSWKRKAVDPVNHKVELGFIIITFLMFLRFFIKSGRRVFQPTKPKIVAVPVMSSQKEEILEAKQPQVGVKSKDAKKID